MEPRRLRPGVRQERQLVARRSTCERRGERLARHEEREPGRELRVEEVVRAHRVRRVRLEPGCRLELGAGRPFGAGRLRARRPRAGGRRSWTEGAPPVPASCRPRRERRSDLRLRGAVALEDPARVVELAVRVEPRGAAESRARASSRTPRSRKSGGGSTADAAGSSRVRATIADRRRDRHGADVATIVQMRARGDREQVATLWKAMATSSETPNRQFA